MAQINVTFLTFASYPVLLVGRINLHYYSLRLLSHPT